MFRPPTNVLKKTFQRFGEITQDLFIEPKPILDEKREFLLNYGQDIAEKTFYMPTSEREKYIRRKYTCFQTPEKNIYRISAEEMNDFIEQNINILVTDKQIKKHHEIIQNDETTRKLLYDHFDWN